MDMTAGRAGFGTNAVQVKNYYSVSKKEPKKPKKLYYNFKSISSQILRAKTSNAAGKVLTKARGVVVSLLRKMSSGEYDREDVEQAVIHARKMERIARKRMKHLRQEEEIKKKGSAPNTDSALEEKAEDTDDREIVEYEEELQVSDEELRRLMKEYQDLMREAMAEFSEEMQIEDWGLEFDELVETVSEMGKEDLDMLKKRHRSQEMREIADADMKYLRAVFAKMEKERQAAVSSNSAPSTPTTTANPFSSNAARLQISGMEIPVKEAQPPQMIRCGNLNIML